MIGALFVRFKLGLVPGTSFAVGYKFIFGCEQPIISEKVVKIKVYSQHVLN